MSARFAPKTSLAVRYIKNIETSGRIFVDERIVEEYKIVFVEEINNAIEGIKEDRPKNRYYRNQKPLSSWSDLENCAAEYLKMRRVTIGVVDFAAPSLPLTPSGITQNREDTPAGFQLASGPISLPQFSSGRIENPPMDLPPPVENFIGRKILLADLLELVFPRKRVTLFGPALIGTTALAYRLVQLLISQNRFPGGYIYCDCRRQPETDDLLRYIAKQCGLDSGSPYSDARLALQGQHRLIILDHADEAENLKDILDVLDSCGALILQREFPDFVCIPKEVDPPTPKEAVQLLQAKAWPMVVDEEIAAQICKFYGYLPGEIVHAGRFMASQREPPAEYLAWLRTSSIAEILQEQRRPSVTLPAIINRYWERMSSNTQDAIKLMAELDDKPMKLAALAAGIGISVANLRRLIAKEGFGIIVRRGEDAYQICHPLYHQYIREKYKK